MTNHKNRYRPGRTVNRRARRALTAEEHINMNLLWSGGASKQLQRAGRDIPPPNPRGFWHQGESDAPRREVFRAGQPNATSERGYRAALFAALSGRLTGLGPVPDASEYSAAFRAMIDGWRP